jgi:hypothetical protein
MPQAFELYHYYDRRTGPFLNLSSLGAEESEAILERVRRESRGYAAQRQDGYMDRRRELEARARALFIEKGGRPRTSYPQYLVVEACPWLETWFEEPESLALPVSSLDPSVLSFSYGDLFPSFSPRVRDGKEYRGRIYGLDEIVELIGRYGLPQRWNPEGKLGPERYIEVEVWDEAESLLPLVRGRRAL